MEQVAIKEAVYLFTYITRRVSISPCVLVIVDISTRQQFDSQVVCGCSWKANVQKSNSKSADEWNRLLLTARWYIVVPLMLFSQPQNERQEWSDLKLTFDLLDDCRYLNVVEVWECCTVSSLAGITFPNHSRRPRPRNLVSDLARFVLDCLWVELTWCYLFPQHPNLLWLDKNVMQEQLVSSGIILLGEIIPQQIKLDVIRCRNVIRRRNVFQCWNVFSCCYVFRCLTWRGFFLLL